MFMGTAGLVNVVNAVIVGVIVALPVRLLGEFSFALAAAVGAVSVTLFFWCHIRVGTRAQERIAALFAAPGNRVKLRSAAEDETARTAQVEEQQEFGQSRHASASLA